MMDNFDYIDNPHLLDEDELAKKPFSEVIKLINDIQAKINLTKADLAIHSANSKTLNKLLSNNKKHII